MDTLAHLNLDVFDVSNCNISDIPEFSSVSDLSVHGNQLTFEDIEPNIGISKFRYDPQDSVSVTQSFVQLEGTSIDLIISVGGVNNTYQWYKDGAIIPGATSDTLSLSNLTQMDEGSYHCEIENTVAIELTLFSRFKHLSVNTVRQLDSLALVSLYNSADGQNWTDGWILADSLDTWSGVTVENDRVTSLKLQDRGLLGTIPDLSQLDQLESLWLQNNNLSGEIPPSIGQLQALTSLRLFSNQLNGEIPAEFGSLSNLTLLWLYNNQLSGSVPGELENLNSLSSLQLHSNHLTGIGNFSFVSTLKLENNRFHFDDIEPNLNVQSFTYAPQDSVEISFDSLSNVLFCRCCW